MAEAKNYSSSIFEIATDLNHSCTFRNTVNSAGTVTNNTKVPNSIPPTTQTPMVRLPLAPAPVANIRGNMPKIIVREVIRMGRNRSFALRNAAFTMDKPFCRPCEAYSVIRMAVLANKPTNIIRPICI